MPPPPTAGSGEDNARLSDTNETLLLLHRVNGVAGTGCDSLSPLTWIRVVPLPHAAAPSPPLHAKLRGGVADSSSGASVGDTAIVPPGRHGHALSVRVDEDGGGGGGGVTAWLFGGSMLRCTVGGAAGIARVCSLSDLWRLSVDSAQLALAADGGVDGGGVVHGRWLQLVPTTPLPVRAYLTSVLVGYVMPLGYAMVAGRRWSARE